MGASIFIILILLSVSNLSNGGKSYVCKGKTKIPTLSADSASVEIQSPNYPGQYFIKGKCSYTIAVKPGLGLDFSCSDFNVNSKKTGKRCKYDKLMFVETTSKTRKQFCGSGPVSVSLPKGKGYKLKITFVASKKTDPKERGFSCKITAVGKPTGEKTTPPPHPGTEKCGIKKRMFNSRIVGGTKAAPHEYPWQVLLLIGPYLCGGSLITNQHIITAAHCTKDTGVKKIKAVLGIHNLEGKQESTTIEMKVIKKTEHPDYDKKSNTNDFSILKLKSPVSFTDAIQPICLPEKGTTDQYVGETAIVTGWGLMKENGNTLATVLMEVGVPVISNDKCQKLYGGDGIKITSHMLCAGKKGKDACQGDSGGPLIVKRPNSNQYDLAGIVSFGIGCGRKDKPGIYSRITSVLPWIYDTIQA